jgi:murein DD-endopeptidase MepM/ murein hydrolase activator NlpD
MIPLPSADSHVVVIEAEDGLSGHGYYEPASGPCLSPEQRSAIQKEIDQSRAVLQADGRLRTDKKHIVLFDWPLRATGDAGLDYCYYALTNYVDQDPATGVLLDYNCGTRVYDGHQGTDVIVWPFTWLRFDAEEIEIVAAAAGTIVLKQDGHFDEWCSINPSGWNAVYVEHADGSVAWYGHMQNGSPTPKAVGETVAAGEYLGLVGSSGSSTEPHLHFEVYDASNSLIDPYSGPCNSLNPSTWWSSQKPYYESQINKLMTGAAAAVFPACPGRETTNEAHYFERGDLAYFTAFYHDQQSGHVTDYRIRDAAGTTVYSWSHTSPATYCASWWYWTWYIPSFGYTNGIWTFEADYNGYSYIQPFGVEMSSDVAGSAHSPGTGLLLYQNQPNPFTPSTALTFSLPRNARVSLALYDVRGAKVRTLIARDMSAGYHTVIWRGEDDSGRLAPSGVYFYHLEAGGQVRTRQMTLVR